MSTLPLHDGPPYPILVDEPTVAGELSVWADPDVGVGTFYVYLNSDWKEHVTEVQLAVRPMDGHVPEATYAAKPARAGEPFQLVGEARFDARGPWTVRFLLDGPAGLSAVEQTVEVTPPGLGALGVVGFLLPFLAIAFLWGAALLKRRSSTRASA